MNVNVYLPDALAEDAKKANLPFSQLLRAAVVEELRKREAMTSTLGTPYPTFVELEDDDGNRYQGRITGSQLAMDGSKRVFLTEDKRVLLHDGETRKYREIEDPVNELRFLAQPAYVGAVTRLGLSPIVDL